MVKESPALSSSSLSVSSSTSSSSHSAQFSSSAFGDQHPSPHSPPTTTTPSVSPIPSYDIATMSCTTSAIDADSELQDNATNEPVDGPAAGDDSQQQPSAASTVPLQHVDDPGGGPAIANRSSAPADASSHASSLSSESPATSSSVTLTTAGPPPSANIPAAGPVLPASTATVAIVTPTARPSLPPPPQPPRKAYSPPSHSAHNAVNHHLTGAMQSHLGMQMAPLPHGVQPIYVAAPNAPQRQQPPPQSQYLQQPTGNGGQQYHQVCLPPPPPPPLGHQWPIVEPVFHFGPGFERSPPYCPTHTPVSGSGPDNIVLFHVNVGVAVTFNINGVQEIIHGPTTVPMVSQGGSPPVAMPVQVPAGHVMQQMVDEHGQLRHVFLSTTHPAPPQPINVVSGHPHHPHHMSGHHYLTNGQPHYYAALSAPGGPPPGSNQQPQHFHHAAAPHHLQPQSTAAATAAMSAAGVHLHSPSPPSAASAAAGSGGNSSASSTSSSSAAAQSHSTSNHHHNHHHNHHNSSSSSATGASNNNNAGNAGMGGYHKDERTQRQHIKLLRKLDARCRAEQQSAAAAHRKDTNGVLLIRGGPNHHNPHGLHHSQQPQHNHHAATNNSNNSSTANNHPMHGNALLNSHPSSAAQHHHNHHAHHSQHQAHHQHQSHHHMPLMHHSGAQQPPPHSLLHSGHSNATSPHQQQQQHHHQQPHVNHILVATGAPPSNPGSPANHQPYHVHQSSHQPPHGVRHPLQMRSPGPLLNGDAHHAHSGSSAASYDEDTTSSLDDGDCAGGPPADDCDDDCDVDDDDDPGDDDETLAIQDQLSSVAPPVVSEVTARTALVQWAAPPPPTPPSRTGSPASNGDPPDHSISAASPPSVDPRELRYEVLLSDRGKEGKYKIIFKGASLTCRIRDLRPGQEYSVCLVVNLHNVHGSASEATVFTTPACEPDAPLPPKCLARTKNSLQLRWNAPNDNGSYVQQYVLEYDEGRNAGDAQADRPATAAHFIEVIRMKGKTYCLAKLEPLTSYQFRLAAINEHGQSGYCEPVAYRTAGNAPAPMPAPVASATSASALHLQWTRRSADEEYALQCSDPRTGHGFLTCYSGRDTEYVCAQLQRAQAYQFRLRAENESGIGQWSDTVLVHTMPERPGRPGRPAPKGRIHATQFRTRWDPPGDTGGAPVRLYTLQIGPVTAETAASGSPPACNGTPGVQPMRTVYTGPDTEALCDRLQPGRTYQLRVNCEGPGGVSAFSELATICTEPVVPDAPAAPVCAASAPGPYAAGIRWSAPSWTGGAPICEYEVVRLNDDDGDGEQPHRIYQGAETHCTVRDLRPGHTYAVQVRAHNRIGPGAWSEALRLRTGAAAPFSPQQPELQLAADGHVTVAWQPAAANGSPILDYQLEAVPVPAGSTVDELLARVSPADADDPERAGHMCYAGPATRTAVRHLLPFTHYVFRVRARNAIGTSLWSTAAAVRTAPDCPGATHIDGQQASCDSVRLQWRAAEPNGSAVLYYVIEDVPKGTADGQAAGTTRAIGQQQRTDDASLAWTVRGLRPETVYRYRVQAVNALGAGPFSAAVRVQTRPLPPRPPRLECLQPVAHNALKLRWADGKNVDFTRFTLEMWNPRAAEFQPIYVGKLLTCKADKLHEQQAYVFRICAESDAAGVGPYSEEYVFRTAAAVPAGVRAPRCTDAGCVRNGADGGRKQPTPAAIVPAPVAGDWSASVQVDWTHSRNTFADPVEYVLEMHGPRSHEFKQVYRGRDNHYRVVGLQTATAYRFRVRPVRCAPQRTARGAREASTGRGTLQHNGNAGAPIAPGDDDPAQPANATDAGDAKAVDPVTPTQQLAPAIVDHFGPYSSIVRHTTGQPTLANAHAAAYAAQQHLMRAHPGAHLFDPATGNRVPLAGLDATDGAPATGGSSSAAASATGGGMLRWAARRFWAHCRADVNLPETEHACFMMIMFLLFCLFCTGVVRFCIAVRTGKI